MNARRRVLKLLGGALVLPHAVRAQGFAGLGTAEGGFQPVERGYRFAFPKDHGAHPTFCTEWWYVTANLKDRRGEALGLQWTLFRQALAPPIAGARGFADPTVWMGHAAVTRASGHMYHECFARGAVGDAGVTSSPFDASIDAWSFRAEEGAHDIERARLRASAAAFAYDLGLVAEGPLVFHGDQGFSQKSETGEASYYYSQPFYRASGKVEIQGTAFEVEGQAWLDREWSSQPLSADQTGWDWFSLHLSGGRKLMLFQLRAKNGAAFRSGTLIEASGAASPLKGDDLAFTPLREAYVAGRDIPVQWRVAVRSLALDVETVPLTDHAWMGTSVSYWEGPISFAGSETGIGYLEMTGY